MIDLCYSEAKTLLIQYNDVLHSCANLLLEKERITREEFEALFDKPDGDDEGQNSMILDI